ncbi:hypothetical protein FA95DRAFT_1630758 [Auriscalpium vulgare]|uniref:Uncharacterized protein n=1 Tax=Auriscalpium vulgare TaxID=40419 RepID=A0ACB8RI76_9AGAM|nr:hypothetical protein FA95DRAFT_1630758 [Auriscalpium vulgare]
MNPRSLVARSDSLHHSFGRVLHGKSQRNWRDGCGPEKAKLGRGLERSTKHEDLAQCAKTGHSQRTRSAHETARTLVEKFLVPNAGETELLTR